MTTTSVPTAALTTFDEDFGSGGSEEFVVRTMTTPRLQWMSGRLKTTAFEVTVGWHIEADVYPELDQILEGLGVKRYLVCHEASGDGGGEKQVPYWALNYGGRSCSLIIIAYGSKSRRDMDRDPQDRYGIAYGWATLKDRDGNILFKEKSSEPKRQCRVQFRTIVHELAQAGYSDWFQVGISGFLTDDILRCIGDQQRVLDAFDARMRHKGSAQTAPFWGFSIPMVPGQGRRVPPKSQQGLIIIPMVSQIPKDPQHITDQYLNQHRIPHGLQERLRAGLLDQCWEWSIQRSLEICGISETQETVEAQPTPPVEEARPILPAATVVDAVPAASSEATVPQVDDPSDPFLTEQQITWLRNMCGNHEPIIAAWCQRLHVADFSQLRSSQLIEVYTSMSQDQRHKE